MADPRSQQWFHGHIGPQAAEELLARAGKQEGLFLLRESAAIVGGYVISVCHNNNIINYRIQRHTDGMVAIKGGKKFAGPVELVYYHQCGSNGLKTKLIEPCNRLSGVPPKTFFGANQKCVRDAATAALSSMGLEEGHEITASLIKDKLESAIGPLLHEDQRWFHGEISRAEAERRLQVLGCQDGMFLVRKNDRGFVLNFAYDGSVNHVLFDVDREGRLSTNSGRKFDYLMLAVDYFTLEKTLQCKLGEPCNAELFDDRRRAPAVGALPADSVPSYVLAGGPKLLAAYRRALETGGKTYDKRVKVLLIGQDRVGKTSLGKNLRGEAFHKKERSTNGVKMIPAIKNAGTEAWRNPDALENTTVFDYKITAMLTGELLTTPAKQVSIEQLSEEQILELAWEEEMGDHDREKEPLHEIVPQEDNTEEKVPTKEDAVPPEIVSLVNQFEKIEIDQDDKIWPVIWDFAGQDVYRAIHPIFMSPDDICLLCFDLRKRFSIVAECYVNVNGEECEVAARDCEDTNLDHIMRWLDLIHSLKNSDENEKPTPVILVGTHADKCLNPKRDIKKVEKKLKEELPKKYIDHIVKLFCIDNTTAGKETNQEKIETLRDEILKLANKMLHTKREIPLQWHQVEKEVIKESAVRKYVDTKTFKDEIASKFCKFDSEDDFDALVHFLHAHGSIVYHEHSGGDGIVVLDPQWLIDVLCQIINVTPCDNERMSISQDRTELQEKGILSSSLLDYACEKHELIPIEHLLISLMDKFNLICEWPGCETGSSLILVPCMLTTPNKETKAAAKKITACSAPLYLNFVGTNYVPFGLFSRLVVLFGKWLSDPKRTNEYELYTNEAKFALDENFVVHLVRYKTVIELCILRGERGEDKPTLPMSEYFESVLRHLMEFLETLKKNCPWLHWMKVELCAQCTVCLGEKTKPCIRHEQTKCRHHDCAHYISLKSKLCCGPGRPLHKVLLQPWIEALTNLESPRNSGNSTGNLKRQGSLFSDGSAPKRFKPTYEVTFGEVSNEDLQRLSTEIGNKWKRLARCLGIKEPFIIGFDLQQNIELDEKAYQMLLAWRRKNGSSATYQVLYEALCNDLVGCKLLAEEFCCLVGNYS